MQDVIQIKGKTAYRINLDPSIWIFDKRKIDLDHFLQTGEHITVPEREISGTYAIPFKPFLAHAVPDPDASSIIVHTSKGTTYTLTLAEAEEALLAFANKGKPLTEDGPIHLYVGQPSHNKQPLTHITAFEVSTED